jgi:phage terminase large subunit GpA-like protein
MDRIEIQVDGWGDEEESWKIAYKILFGDPEQKDIWDQLWEYLRKPHGNFYIRAAGVDTGGMHTQQAYKWCSPRLRSRFPDGRLSFIFAMKGQTGQGGIWPKRPAKKVKGQSNVVLWPIKVDPAKESLYARLGRVVEPGPGYVHFPILPEFENDYFKQLTAERIVQKTNPRGYSERVWELKVPGSRNEALDTAVYSYAALCGLRAMGMNYDQEKLRAGRKTEPVERAEPEPVVAPEPLVPPRRKKRKVTRHRSRSSLL